MKKGRIELQKFDKNMKTAEASNGLLEWRHAFDKPFLLVGFKWFEQDRVYFRLPVNPARKLPPGPEGLKRHTAGGQLRFRTNSRKIAVRGRLQNPSSMGHMPCTGQSGFDLYIGPPQEERFYKVTRFSPNDIEFDQDLFEADNRKIRHFTINFP